MEHNAAVIYAERLSVMKFFPEGMPALEQVASLIAELAKDETEAESLVNAMCKKFNNWPGPLGLKQTYRGLYGCDETPEWDASEYERSPASKICPGCYNTGREQVWTLHTYNRRPNGASYQQREIIPDEETAQRLREKCDGHTQIVYSNVRHCTKCARGLRKESAS